MRYDRARERLFQYDPVLNFNEKLPPRPLDQLQSKMMRLHGSAMSISGSFKEPFRQIGLLQTEAIARLEALPPILNDDHLGLKQLG